MASTYLTKSMSGNTASTKMTFSAWIKKSDNDTGFFRLFGTRDANHVYIFQNNIYFDVTNTSGTAIGSINTTRVLRDNHAFYHIVAVLDTTLSTATDRQKIYINGERATDINVTTQVSQNATTDFGANGVEYSVGARTASQGTAGGYFDGSMAHVHYTDGYAYQASTFGETDATTGIWKPKTQPSVTYGTNGFFLKFESSGNMGLDSSGNSNNFTVNGSMTQSISTPSNIFANISPLHKFGASMNITNNNLTVANSSGSNAWQMEACSHGFTKGKYYFEYKMTTLGLNNGYHKLGFISDVSSGHGSAVYPSETAVDGGYVFYNSGGSLEVRTDDNVITGYDQSTLGVSFTTNDIMCLAIDKTNNRVYFRKNDDAWIKSADPVAGTNGLDISSDYTTDKLLVPAIAQYGSGSVGSFNFGEGFFGTTAVASANADSNGIGAFEFAPPTGFLSLCTKSINAQEYS